MTRTWKLLVATAISALPTSICSEAAASSGPPDGSTHEQQQMIAADPVFHARTLELANLPRSRRAPTLLFNGRDLKGWDTWLGYTQPMATYSGAGGAPIGLNQDTTGVFRVVTEDGRPAIYSSGKIFGALTTKRSYGNYHLRLQYKWGANSWFPIPRNNGILYHSQGPYGTFFGTWMTALEFEIVPRSVGMLLTVGDSRQARSFDTVDWKIGANVEVGQDAAIAYPKRRYMPGGRLIPIQFPAFNVEASVDAERPVGEWNTLDLYVFGDRSIHVVNGIPILLARDLSISDKATGRKKSLVAGRLQLQSEGSETYFRDILIEPIDHLPAVTVTRRQD